MKKIFTEGVNKGIKFTLKINFKKTKTTRNYQKYLWSEQSLKLKNTKIHCPEIHTYLHYDSIPRCTIWRTLLSSSTNMNMPQFFLKVIVHLKLGTMKGTLK